MFSSAFEIMIVTARHRFTDRFRVDNRGPENLASLFFTIKDVILC